MANWRKQQGASHHQVGQWNRSYSGKPPLADRWQATVPAWEKKFCAVIGSVPWPKVIETKRYIYLHDNVVKWDDSAGKEAFDNAKMKFWAEINGLPCNISLPDPDMYNDDIDWNLTVDPELILDLEREPAPSEEASDEVVILDSSHLLDQSFFCTGWGEAETPPPTGWGEAETPPTPPPTGWGEAETPPPTGWGEAEIPPPTGWGEAEIPPPTGQGQAEVPPSGWGEAEMPPPTGWGKAEIPPPTSRREAEVLAPTGWGDSDVNINSQVDNCTGWVEEASGLLKDTIPVPRDPNPNVNSGVTEWGEAEMDPPKDSQFPPPEGWNSDQNVYGGVNYSTGWGKAETNHPKDTDTFPDPQESNLQMNESVGSWEQYCIPQEPAKVSEGQNHENDSWRWKERQQSGFQKTGRGRGIGNWGSSDGYNKKTSGYHGNDNQIGGRGRRNNRGRKRGGFAYGRSYGDNLATTRWEVKIK